MASGDFISQASQALDASDDPYFIVQLGIDDASVRMKADIPVDIDMLEMMRCLLHEKVDMACDAALDATPES